MKSVKPGQLWECHTIFVYTLRATDREGYWEVLILNESDYMLPGSTTTFPVGCYGTLWRKVA